MPGRGRREATAISGAGCLIGSAAQGFLGTTRVFVLHFLLLCELPCPGRLGPASRAFVLQKLGLGGGVPVSEASRQTGLGAIRPGAPPIANTCTNIIALRQRCDQFHPIHTTRALPAGPRCQYNRRVRARSSVDRAPASGAGCGSSSLPGRTSALMRFARASQYTRQRLDVFVDNVSRRANERRRRRLLQDL